ncbi:MAG: GNAT family N-acetyltransferase [Thermoplasmatales archaeon]|nr:GNAT family N-acetyltransferase [Thermoplasmatales archaeon]
MIQIRSARITDALIFYKARFNPVAIKYSKTKNIPIYAEHVKWFEKNYQTGVYTILLDGKPIGYVRIDKNVIFIAVLQEYQKKGFATEALGQLLKHHKNLTAEIYPGNIASVKLFKHFPEIKLNTIKSKEGE